MTATVLARCPVCGVAFELRSNQVLTVGRRVVSVRVDSESVVDLEAHMMVHEVEGVLGEVS